MWLGASRRYFATEHFGVVALQKVFFKTKNFKPLVASRPTGKAQRSLPASGDARSLNPQYILGSQVEQSAEDRKFQFKTWQSYSAGCWG